MKTGLRKQYGMYEKATGRLLYSFTCLDKELKNWPVESTEAYEEFPHRGLEWYWDENNGTWVEQQECPVVLTPPLIPKIGEDFTLENLPIPCVVRVDNEEYQTTSESILLRFQNPGNHVIVIQYAQFKKHEIKINVEA